MNKNNSSFVYYKKYKNFKRDKDLLSNNALIFVEDRKSIWTHGVEYGGSGITIEKLQEGVWVFKDNAGETLATINTLSLTEDDVNRLIASGVTITIDSELSDTSTNAVQNKTVKAALDTKLNIQSYVVDSRLDDNSTNPVQNRAIKQILDLKANAADLNGYVLKDTYNKQIALKLDFLTAGSGIEISNNIISSTLDTSVYLIVTELPSKLDASQNKIYLLEVANQDGTYRYEQYRLKGDQWVSFDAVTPTVDFSPYLRKDTALTLYQPIGDYVTSLTLAQYAKVEDLIDIRQELNGYAPAQYVENTYQRKGNYATIDYVDSVFLKLADIYFSDNGGSSTGEENNTGSNTNPGGGNSGSGNSGNTQPIVINTGNEITVDFDLSLQSSNPVENRTVTAALNTKANLSDLKNYALASQLNNKLDSNALDNYATKADVNQSVSTKQDILIPGKGIDITNNVISSTIDTSLWKVVDELPTTNIDPDKIYIIELEENGETIYVEWVYKNGEWVSTGHRTPEIDLSGYQRVGDYATNSEVANTYLTKADAASQYQPTGNYATVTDVANTYQEKGNYIDTDIFDTFRSYVNNTYQRRGQYALADEISAALIALQEIIDSKYVLKKDVYNPEHTEFSTEEPTQITIGGSGSGSVVVGGSRMVTLTQSQYEQLVADNLVDPNTYYFTYEGEEPSGNSWHFGDSFPIIFTDNWAFGGTFPITLT